MMTKRICFISAAMAGVLFSDMVRAQEVAPTATDDVTRVYGLSANELAKRSLSRGQADAFSAAQNTTKKVVGDITHFPIYLESQDLTKLVEQGKVKYRDTFALLWWHQIALDMTSIDHTSLGTPGQTEATYAEQFGPTRSSRAMAIAHLAMFEAVNLISKRFQSYQDPAQLTDVQTGILARLNMKASDVDGNKASVSAAISYAAHDTLARLYPQKRSLLDVALLRSVTLIDGATPGDVDAPQKVALGRLIGMEAANQVVGMRQDDGSQVSAPPPLLPGGTRDLPNFPACQGSLCLESHFRVKYDFPVTTRRNNPYDWQQDDVSRLQLVLGANWGDVRPFVTSRRQFFGKRADGNMYLNVDTPFADTQKPPTPNDPRFIDALDRDGYGPMIDNPWKAIEINKMPVPFPAQISSSYGVRDFGGYFDPAAAVGQMLPSGANEGPRFNVSTMRSQDQYIRGIFWAYDGTALLCAPPRLYNMIATAFAFQKKPDMVADVSEMARYLSLVNLALADAGFAAWDAKFYFHVARPLTYLRYHGGGVSGQPSAYDDYWTPLGQGASNGSRTSVTPPFPSYPSGHAVFGGALFELISRFFGVNKDADESSFEFISDEYNGVNEGEKGPRDVIKITFRSLKAAEWENAESRIWLGIHWQFDADDGAALGDEIGAYVIGNALKPVP